MSVTKDRSLTIVNKHAQDTHNSQIKAWATDNDGSPAYCFVLLSF